MNFNINQKVGAEFKLIVRKSSDNSISTETSFFQNLVLDTGLDRMNVGAWIDRCCVGSGNSTPIASQTSLDSFVASSTTRQESSFAIETVSPCYYSATINWRFGVGVAAGNLSEVGLGWGNLNLWNRSLIKDINGMPTTITILPDEYLDVISVIKIYPVERISGSFNLLDKNRNPISSHSYEGTPYLAANFLSATFNAVNIGNTTLNNGFYMYSGARGQNITTLPTGLLSSNSTSKVAKRLGRVFENQITIGLNTANSAPHRSIYAAVGGILLSEVTSNNTCGYQVEFTPPLRQKLSTETMTYNISLSWSRIT